MGDEGEKKNHDEILWFFLSFLFTFVDKISSDKKLFPPFHYFAMEQSSTYWWKIMIIRRK